MRIHAVKQGSEGWHKLRSEFDTASEAPAMMGESPYQTRNHLLRQKKTGIAPEVDAATQKRFNDGYDAEDNALEIAERIVGGNLFPGTVTEEVDGLKLLASVDGMTLDGKILWEHKLWNQKLAAAIQEGDVLHHRFQLEQQLLVTDAEKTLFMCSDGTEENCVWLWYESDRKLRDKLIAGWKQFHKDLETFEPEAAAPVVTGLAPVALPALRIQVRGEVADSNLVQFKATALSVIGKINTDLQTDQDFADAEKSVKWCKDVEDSLTSAKQHALSQTESIDALFRAIDEIREKTRSTRLTLEKLVKSRKDEIRAAEVARGIREYREFVKGLAVGMDFNLQGIVPDPQFGAAIKGIKTVKSLKDRIDTELANLKIEATEIVTKVRSNLEALRKESRGYESLVYDTTTLVLKDQEDMLAVIRNRIRDAKDREERAAKARSEAQAQVDKVVQEYEPPEPEDAPEPAIPTLDEMMSALARIYHTDPETVLGWITDAITHTEDA